MNCVYCGKETKYNYCDIQCHIDEAFEHGGKVICPNDLPIVCFKHDFTMMEHEHADNPSYKFPVNVKYIGYQECLPEWDNSYDDQIHALIFNDDNIAITLYEATYSMFRLDTGIACYGSILGPDQWRLTSESLAKIKKGSFK